MEMERQKEDVAPCVKKSNGINQPPVLVPRCRPTVVIDVYKHESEKEKRWAVILALKRILGVTVR